MRGAADPDDVTSEVFLAVYERLAGFEGSEAAFRSWLFTIAHRKAVDARRRLARRPWAEVADSAASDLPGGNVEDEALAAVTTGRVLALLAELPEVQRDVLLLRIVADLSIDQAADVMGKSPGAIKQHQRRALNQLRVRVQRAGVTL
jgi:RNA polymerase sigma factor (sigma-70 family)